MVLEQTLHRQKLKHCEKRGDLSQSVRRFVTASIMGKAPPVEKPIMFAFCLKPRDQDRAHTRARRFNSFVVGDEKATNFDVSPENSDNFSMLQTSTSSPEECLVHGEQSIFFCTIKMPYILGSV
ncbi:hypothetical protein POM88_042341 [Heracleum sosnowskyi]|uniref:Uncharacterized protein n=1 Tax=Heracleum sosnowskyi TaxID=360622 RepID=A0AAD8M941_9APIA|nr:hypothetical protein POM88_042341 [Heracleum sosnowskyi]